MKILFSYYNLKHIFQGLTIYKFKSLNSFTTKTMFLTFYFMLKKIFYYKKKLNNLFFIYNLIINYFGLCIKLLSFMHFFKCNYTSLPKKISRYTVLKSPHIDKRSREQFQLIQYKKLLKIPFFFISTNNFFFNQCTLVNQNLNFVLNSHYYNR